MLSLVVAACVAAADAGVPPVAEPEPFDAGVVEPLPPVAVVSAEAEPTAPSQFIKGELSMYLGSDRLVVKNTRIGVSAGLDRFGPAYYLLVEPMVDLRFLDGRLGVGLGVPLRLELVNFSNGPDGEPILIKRLGRVRTEDWDSLHDFGRLLKYVTWGRKEDNLYISAGQRYATSIGHGALMRRYAPNIDIDYPRASAEVDWYNDFAGFELHTNDVLEWNTLAGIAFVKPLAFISRDNLFTKSFSIGVSGAIDWKAPWELQHDATGVRLCDDGSPNGVPCQPGLRLSATQRAVKLVGFDAELKVVKTANLDIKPYVDYSLLLGGDGGFTAGVLGRFNVGTSTVHAFRVVGELRFLGSRFQPGYFDTFYEVDRFVFKERPRVDPNVANYATKYDYILNTGLGERVGYYFEGSWGIPGKVGFTLALEGVSNAPEKNLIAHLEVPVLDFLQVFGSYYKRNLVSFGELGAIEDKTILFAGARLKILPFLFLNGRAYKTFRMNPDLQRYDNQFGFVIDLEVGYEFHKSNLPPPPPDAAPPPTEGAPPPAPAPTPPPELAPSPYDAPAPTPAEGTPTGQPGR